MEHMESPVWFITGCSTGFGKELAKLVLERGWKAVVTARKPEQVRELVEGYQGNALALALDVTKPEQVEQAVEQAQAKFGRIDVLVNNAGYGYLAAIEEGEEKEIRDIFETNVFGLIALTKAVLPGMRKQRSGRIVNFSSIGGLTSFAATGYYHGTKYAVEGLSESLSLEVAPLGIRVIIVEPGPFRTDWLGRSLVKAKDEIADYDSTVGERRRQGEERDGKQQGDPVRGSEVVIKAVMSDDPPLRLLLGKPALDLAEKKIAAMQKDFADWREETLSADYPEFQAK